MKFKISIFFLLLIINQLSNCMQSLCQTEQRECSEYIRTNNCLGYDIIKKLISQTTLINKDLLLMLGLLTAFDLINVLKDKSDNYFSTTLIGHNKAIWFVSFSPDGTKIATESYDDTAKVWDVSTGNLINSIGSNTDSARNNTVEVHSLTQSLTDRVGIYNILSYNSDSKIIATGYEDGTAKIWDVDTGNLIHSLTDHTGTVQFVTFSTDDRKLATCSEKIAKVWDVDTGNLIYDLNGHTGTILAIIFSHDCTMLATCSEDETVKIWDVDTGDLILNLTIHAGNVRTISFSPDNTKLATCSCDGIAKIWDIKTANLIYSLTAHNDYITSVSFSDDCKQFATGSEDKTVKIWHLDKISEIQNEFRTLNYEQLELLQLICDALKSIKDNQYIKFSRQQKIIIDSLPICIKRPLKLIFKKINQKFCQEKEEKIYNKKTRTCTAM